MAVDESRSEQVIQDYKKHKLARSALRKIQSLIQGFEQERVADARLARFGLLVLLLIVGAAAYFFHGGESVILP